MNGASSSGASAATPLTDRPLRIGTRGSPLALVQTRTAAALLKAAWPGLPEPEIVVVKTTGDRVTDRPLADIGGKGLFAKEIEAALLAGRIDCAVHSMKDMETVLPAGLTIGAALERADPRDTLVALDARTPADLPKGGTVATASIRREAQLRALRPDLSFVMIRGNVGTRIEKLRNGLADATFLAQAGLDRLGLALPEATPVEPDVLLPSACQGIVGIECRADDESVRALLEPVNHSDSRAAMLGERATLAALDGSCRTPIAALAEPLDGGDWRLRALVALPDGSGLFATERRGGRDDLERLGADAGVELKRRAPAWVFEDPPAGGGR